MTAQVKFPCDFTSVSSGAALPYTVIGPDDPGYRAQAAQALSGVTSPTPPVGARQLQVPTSGEICFFTNAGLSAYVPAGTYVLDEYLQLGTSGSEAPCGTAYNDGWVEYTWGTLYVSGGQYRVRLGSYDDTYGVLTNATSSAVGTFAANATVRVRTTFASNRVYSVELFVGSNVNGTTADATATDPGSAATIGYHSWERAGIGSGVGTAYLDDFVFGYPVDQRNVKRGQSTGTVTVGGTGAGRRQRTGSASGTVTVGGTVDGRAERVRQASGVATIGGTVTGHSTTQGVSQASGVVTIGGTVAGHRTAAGDTTGTVTISGTALGHAIRHGSATGTLAISAGVNGGAFGGDQLWGDLVYWGDLETWWHPWKRAQTTGAVTVGGTATGHAHTLGTATGGATGAVGLSGVASGHAVRRGSATGVLGMSGTATGRRVSLNLRGRSTVATTTNRSTVTTTTNRSTVTIT